MSWRTGSKLDKPIFQYVRNSLLSHDLTLSLLLSQRNQLHELVKRNTISGGCRQPTEPPARHAEKREIVAGHVGSWITEDVNQEDIAGHDWYLDKLPVRWT